MKKISIMLLMVLVLMSNVSVFASANTATTEQTYVVERTNYERVPYMRLGDNLINVWGDRDIITLADSEYKQLVQKGVKLSLLDDRKILTKASEGRYTIQMLNGRYKITAGTGYIVGLDNINPLGEPTQGELIGMYNVGEVIDFKSLDYKYFQIVGLDIEKLK